MYGGKTVALSVQETPSQLRKSGVTKCTCPSLLKTVEVQKTHTKTENWHSDPKSPRFRFVFDVFAVMKMKFKKLPPGFDAYFIDS